VIRYLNVLVSLYTRATSVHGPWLEQVPSPRDLFQFLTKTVYVATAVVMKIPAFGTGTRNISDWSVSMRESCASVRFHVTWILYVWIIRISLLSVGPNDSGMAHIKIQLFVTYVLSICSGYMQMHSARRSLLVSKPPPWLGSHLAVQTFKAKNTKIPVFAVRAVAIYT
jgi:hypothetical protein